MRATWKPHEKHGDLTGRSDLPDSVFAYPHERKEPLTDASHVRNAIARFDQVEGVSDQERSQAFANIKKAAAYYGVDLSEADWHELGRTPKTGETTADRKRSARKGVATRKKSAARKKTGARKKAGASKATSTRKKAGTRKKARKASPAKKTAGRKKTAARKKAGTRKKVARKKRS
jgi:hypothetical protein